MSPDNRAGVFEANARARHSRIAVGINEIDLAAEEDVPVIRTPCDKNQNADENDFRQEREAPPHAPFKSDERDARHEREGFSRNDRKEALRQSSFVIPSEDASPARTEESLTFCLEERIRDVSTSLDMTGGFVRHNPKSEIFIQRIRG